MTHRVRVAATVGVAVIAIAGTTTAVLTHLRGSKPVNPARAAASGFVSLGASAVPSCNAGRGVTVPVGVPLPANGIFQMTDVTSPSGITYVAISGLGMNGQVTRVWALSSSCDLVPTFGHDGVSEPLTPPTVLGGFTLVGLASNGDVFVAGGNTEGEGGHADLGMMTPRGGMDLAFGTNGWSPLPWPGQISAASQEPTGRILIAVDDSGGAFGSNWVSALTTSGRVDLSFGHKGAADIPRYADDVSIAHVVAESDGQIVTLTTGGNMGQWESYPTVLSANGILDTSFESAFWRTLDTLDPSRVLDADLVTSGSSIGLVGTQQNQPVDAVPGAHPSGRWYLFGDSGSLSHTFGRGGFATFPSVIEQDVTTVVPGAGGAVMAGSALRSGSSTSWLQRIDLTALTPSGHIDSTYGVDGVATVVLPYAASDFPTVSVTISREDVVVLASEISDGTSTGDSFKFCEYTLP